MDVWTADAPHGILVQVAAARVRLADETVPLRCREIEIAVALAVQTHPVSAEFLTALLYPERDAADANNMLHVNLYRLRKRLVPGFAIYAERGFRLGAGVAVDVVQGRAAVERLSRTDRPLEPAECEAMLRLARGLRAEAPAMLLGCAWFDPVERLARRLGRDLTMLLARHTLQHDNLHEAMRIANELTYEDVCDEEAWELLIGAQLRLGRRAAALQGFRFYEAALARELSAQPSRSLRQLVEEQRDAVAI
ncbi:MAG: hypothetical protein QOJ39_2374 [Candidatus Eremiobacteraeota bacterium]|jgi:DNA-binding SARP family transcriptional activator|nr:hypothetical protein [Candidatus Eremiobacteraeota bacterium]MEA2720510.1 hypothetical protein [Candidatus Eremiobacteraeota bacterium]